MVRPSQAAIAPSTTGRFDHELFRGHGASEWRLRALRSAWTILRPVRFMSHVPFAWRSVLDRGQLLEPHGGSKVVMIDPHDIGAVTARVLTTAGHEGKTYELSDQALTGPEIAADLAAALGPVEFVDAGDDEYLKDLIASGVPPEIAEGTLASSRSCGRGTSTKRRPRRICWTPPRSYRDWLVDHPPEISR